MAGRLCRRGTDTALAAAAEVLDFSEPVAVMLVAVLHMLRDEEDPGGIVTRFFDGLRLADPGVVLTHEWRPDSAEESATPGVLRAGVAGKP
jgi:hypothetical protein